MKRIIPEPETSPLDDVLRSLPEETPPSDLEGRIVDALAEQRKVLRPRAGRAPRWLPPLMAAAAVFVLLISTQAPKFLGGLGSPRETARKVAYGVSPSVLPKAADASESAPMKADARKTNEAPAEYGAPYVPPLPPAPGSEHITPYSEKRPTLDETPKGAGSASASKAAPDASAGRTVKQGETEAPALGRAEDGAPAGVAEEQFGTSHTYNDSAKPAAAKGQREPVKAPNGEPSIPRPSVPDSGATPGYGLPDKFDAPKEPWRDESGERQQITSKTLELEVKHFDEAHARTKLVLERAHAIVVAEDMDLRDRGPAWAHIAARVPVDQVDGVIAQLRELGKVLRLTSGTEDATREYYGQGATVREGGATEDELVAQYEAEKNTYRKQELYRRIMALRQKVGQQKTQLEDLSEQTHSVLLDITLKGRSGPSEFLSRAIPDLGQAILWMLVTAVFWGPLALVAWWLWRRDRAAK